MDVSHEDDIQVSRFDNDFEVIETLGAGNFGKVVKCRNKLDNAMYAVKITSKSLKSRPTPNGRGHAHLRYQRSDGSSVFERHPRKSPYREVLQRLA